MAFFKNSRFPWKPFALLTAFLVVGVVGFSLLLSIDEELADDSDIRLVRRDIPDSQNAYMLLASLAEIMPDPINALDDDAQEHVQLVQMGEDPWDDALILPLLTALDPRIADWEAALATTDTEFPEIKSLDQAIPGVAGFRRFATLVNFKARHLMRAGRFDEGIRMFGLSFTLARQLQNTSGNLIIWLTGTAIQSMTVTAIRTSADEVVLSPDATQRLIALLEKHRSPPGNLAKALRGEYQFYNLVSQIIETKGWAAMTGMGYGPAAKEQYLALLPFAYKPNKTRNLYTAYLRRVIASVDLDGEELHRLQSSGELDPQIDRSHNPVNILGRQMLSTIVPTFSSLISTQNRSQSHISATQAALAVRAYQHEHDGALPDTLDQLLPTYLPAVPLDYYDRQPIRYSRAYRSIWSLGREGTYDVISAAQESATTEIHLKLRD